MRILLPTGEATEGIVREAAREYDAEVVVTGKIASFLTPSRLRELICQGNYDMVIVSGMCTASFWEVEDETGVPIFLGPRHAADLPLILPLAGEVTLSRSIPADELISREREKEARKKLLLLEDNAGFDLLLRGCKIGGGSRMKVLAEIMDAQQRPDLLAEVERLFSSGADIVDLGFGFDATPDDVRRCFSELKDLPGPLSVDTQDPSLITAALERADLVLSLQEENIPLVGESCARAGTAAVVVPGEAGLFANIRAAEIAGVKSIIADPLLQPAGSGLVESLSSFRSGKHPLFFGAGNVTELIDADSPGVVALLTAMAKECGAGVIFASEHSDKTRGAVAEMRRATEMMALMEGRPYPKDLGIDLLCIKEKRRRREPPLLYSEIRTAGKVPEEIVYDPLGNFRIGIENGWIVAVRNEKAVRGKTGEEVLNALLSEECISRLDHAAYLGKELFKAECALRFKRSFEQDGPF